MNESTDQNAKSTVDRRRDVMAEPVSAPRFSPADLAAMLGLPTPTAEQQAVITAPLSPSVVIAGAGSGKTETMSARVLWLVANGYVRPDRVLGLTFTNKAAAELSQRIRLRLGQLAHSFPDPDQAQQLLAEPTVTTYHAYAGRLVNEHALRLGVEPATQLLTQALTWQCAQRIVHSFDGDLPNIDKAESTVVNWVLDLAGELAEHLRTTEELADWTELFAKQVAALPRGKRLPGEPYAKVKELLRVNLARSELIPLVDRYEQAKRRAGTMDFGDQMSLAARLAHQFTEVGRTERSRYSVVLLDEYQDTGHAQLVLLKSLFGNGHPVTAVGDPCQSIYGWRGASAGNLARFIDHFSSAEGKSAQMLSLSVSFRNDQRILDLANRISAPLRDQGMEVAQLTSGPRAQKGWVRCALLSTVEDEAEWLADQISQIWQDDADLRERGQGRSIAVLARRRSAFTRIEQALRSREIPVELVGLGGLLATPEVRDLVSTLRVLSDPTAGDAVVRLLTGARWRIGPRDLRALGLRARELIARDQQSTVDDDAAIVHNPQEQACLIEALDDLGSPDRYSAEGFRRLSAFSRELSYLRQRTSQPLPDLVADVERTMRLDIEIASRSHSGADKAGRVHLDRFGDVVNQFAEQSEHAALGAFLSYLAAAEAEERGLETGPVQVDGDRVQILTVHAAKGLEWDVVAVPGLSTSVFPDRDAIRGSGWLTGAARLPYPLRGDAGDLPDLEPMAADDQKELDELREDFVSRCADRGELEERRLAYVAFTRARQLLLCSGYWWDEASRPRGPSVFLTDAKAACQAGAGDIAQWCPAPADDENPLLAEDRSQFWPIDPLSVQRSNVDKGAALVWAALANRKAARQPASDSDRPSTMDNKWSAETELLLRERAERGTGSPPDIVLSSHLSVSSLVALRRDPQELARHIRRPMPRRPAPVARRGTAFHVWLEQRYSSVRLLDIEELPGAADETATGDEDVEYLQQQFLASSWANRQPVEVEIPFEMVLDGVPVRGRIDAVFQDSQGFWDVVDWKTGSQPASAEAREAMSVQLAAYRLAWAELAGVRLDTVRAAFHYVRDNHTVRPTDLLDVDGLTALLRRIPVIKTE